MRKRKPYNKRRAARSVVKNNGLEALTGTLPRLGSRVRIPSPAPIKPKQLHDISNPLRNVVDKVGYLRIAVGLTFPFPLIRRGLGPAGTAGTTGTARCSAQGWTTGGVRKIPAEARSTVRPTVSAPPRSRHLPPPR